LETLGNQNKVKEQNNMKIKTTSGATRGVKDSGTTFEYYIEKETFLALVGRIFDREVEDYSSEHETAGGAVSQFLHAYGVSADKLEKSGVPAFPAVWLKDEDGRDLAWDEVYAVDEMSEEAVAKLTEKERGVYEEGLEVQADKFIALRDERIKMEFGPAHIEKWFEALDFKTPRAKKAVVPLVERQTKWDATCAKMSPFMSMEEIIEALGKRPLK
jgi:uncharacterized protein YfcZ (UPF0381/DUF406 family)